MIGPCSACPYAAEDYWIVQPDGPLDAETLFLGEQPAVEEHYKHRPFVGKTGREFDGRLLPTAGLSRPNVRVTNAMLCFTAYKPKDWQVDQCAAHHLRQTIEEMPNLKRIVPMGRHACRVIDPSISLDLHHGFVRVVEPWPDSDVILDCLPTIHPAAGMHQPRLMREIGEDFLSLRDLIGGVRREPVDEFPDPIHAEWGGQVVGQGKMSELWIAIDTERDMEDADQSVGGKSIEQGDEEPEPDSDEADNENGGDGAEGDRGEASQPDPPAEAGARTPAPRGIGGGGWGQGSPWSLQFSVDPEHGYFIPAYNHGMLQRFGGSLQLALRLGAKVIFHNEPADNPVLEELLGFRVPDGQWVDSMVRAFHLSLPQGLKTLAYRQCGITGPSYSALVTPHSLAAFDQWLAEALAWVESEQAAGQRRMLHYLVRVHKAAADLPKDPAVKLQLSSRLKRILGDVSRYDEVDLFERWEKVPLAMRKQAARKLKADPPEPVLVKWDRELRKVGRRKGVKRWEGWAKVPLEIRQTLESRFGPAPKSSIVHVPFRQALDYAAGDAVKTLRVWWKLEELAREQAASVPQEEWDDHAS